MALNRTEMEEVIRRSIEIKTALDALVQDDLDPDERIVAGPPASEESIMRLVSSLPHRLPPSYLQLLSLHDGIASFFGSDDADLLSSRYPIDHAGFDRDWDRPHMFFFIMGNEWDAVAFDTGAVGADGEMEVQEIERNCDTVRWPSLSDFLVGYCGRLEKWLADAQADRAALEDD